MTRDPFERVNEDEDLSNVAEFPALSSYTSSTLSAEHKLRIASSKRGAVALLPSGEQGADVSADCSSVELFLKHCGQCPLDIIVRLSTEWNQ